MLLVRWWDGGVVPGFSLGLGLGFMVLLGRFGVRLWARCGCLWFAVDFGVIGAVGMQVFGNAVVIWAARCVCLVWFLL